MSQESNSAKVLREMEAKRLSVAEKIIDGTIVTEPMSGECVIEEVDNLLTAEQEEMLGVKRREMMFLERLRFEKAHKIIEITEDPDWEKEYEDTPETSKFAKVYQHFISGEQWQRVQNSDSEHEDEVVAFITEVMDERREAGEPMSNEDASFAICDMLNNIYKKYLTHHLMYLDDKIERYLDILAELKLAKEFEEILRTTKLVKVVKEEEDKENSPADEQPPTSS